MAVVYVNIFSIKLFLNFTVARQEPGLHIVKLLFHRLALISMVRWLYRNKECLCCDRYL